MAQNVLYDLHSKHFWGVLLGYHVTESKPSICTFELLYNDIKIMGIAVKEEVDSSAGTMFNICVLVHAVSTKPNTIFNIQTLSRYPNCNARLEQIFTPSILR